MAKTYVDILKRYEDKENADFSFKLTPGLKRDEVIGVRVPQIRQIAKEIAKNEDYNEFLDSLPHKYFDENMLHSCLLSQIKNYDECIEKIDKFLPYVNNWATCDIISPKIFLKNKDKLLLKIRKWCSSDKEFTIRFGILMLMCFFLDTDFNKDQIYIVLGSKMEEYYAKMMVAWYFATALAKQWNDTIWVIENKVLPPWVHNKSIQKSLESFRITTEQKTYLKTLKIK